MPRHLLNTLFVQHPEAYVRAEGETVRVEVEEKCLVRVPLHHLDGVVLFGTSGISPGAMHRCVREGRAVTFLDHGGRFRCRVAGPVHGNVLLRLAQYDALRDSAHCVQIARCFVAAKLRNSRQLLLRAARDAKTPEVREAITAVAVEHAESLALAKRVETLDDLRGCEGNAAALYFGVFGKLLAVPPAEFSFVIRSRRPPRDRVNALLSFVYALLANDCTAAAEGVGLDPQVGFLHAVRPGRPSLALDLMEEFRAFLADRLVLTLINLRQIRPEHFETREQAGESVLLTEAGRKLVITAYQKRKEETVRHRLLKEAVPLGLLPHLQARLLARHLRGDTEAYHPFLV